MAYGVHYIGVRLPLLFELVSPQEAVVRGSTPFKVNAPKGNPNLIADVAKEHGLPT